MGYAGTGLRPAPMLRPCPSCGGELVMVKQGDSLRARCLACGATTDMGLLWGTGSPRRPREAPQPKEKRKKAPAKSLDFTVLPARPKSPEVPKEPAPTPRKSTKRTPATKVVKWRLKR